MCEWTLCKDACSHSETNFTVGVNMDVHGTLLVASLSDEYEKDTE